MANRGPGEAIELGVAYLSVVGETDKLAESVRKAARKAQGYLDTHPLKLKADIDVSHIGAVEIPVIADTDRFTRSVRAAIQDARRYAALNTIDLRVNLDPRNARFGQGAIPVDPDMARFANQVQGALRDMERSGAFRLNVPVEMDMDQARSDLRGLRDELARTSSATHRIGIDIDVDDDTIGSIAALAAALGSLPGITSGIAAIAGQISSIAGSAGSASAAVDGLAASLAALESVDVSGIELPDLEGVTRAHREIRTAFPDIQLHVEVIFDIDRTVLTGQLDVIQEAVRQDPLTVPVRFDVSSANLPRQLQRSMREIRRNFSWSLEVDVIPDFARFPARMEQGLREIRRHFNWSIQVDVELNTAAALAAMAALQAALQRMARPIDQDVNIDRDADRGVGGLSAGLGSVAKAAGGIAATAAAIALIGGVAGTALGAVAALGVGLIALGPAAAAAAATITVGVKGIGDAFTALSAAEESAGADAQAQAQAIVSAQERVISAHEQVDSALDGVTSAQRSFTDAQKDARDAAKDIEQAYKDAREQLEDYNFAVKDASLSEAEAALSLREARDEFAKALPQDREKAYLRLQRADLRYQQSVEKNKDTQAEANEALEKGVENSDRVVAAKDRAAQADQRVADAAKGVEKAHQQVEKAQRQVEQAQQALTDATTKTSSAQDKAAQALAKLSPNAREFVLAVRAAAPAWEELTRAVQDRMFAGAATDINNLVTNSLPTVKAGMVEVAGSMNGLAHQFAAFWQAPQNLAGVQSIFAGTAKFIDGLGPGLMQATQGFLSIGKAFEPVANQVGAQVGGLFGQIGQAFTDAFDDGSLTQLFATFGNIIEGLGQGLKPFIAGLIEIGNAVGPTLGPLFANLGEAFKELAPALGSIGKTFVETLIKLMPTLTTFIDALLRGLEPVLPVIGQLLDAMGRALIPLIGPLSQIAQVVGNALVKAINALAPAIGPISAAFASLVTALAPILPVIAEVAAGILTALAPALTTVFDALGPVIKQIADLMMPVFRQLQPILADVAQQIGTALADALTQIAPHLPAIAKSFGDLVLALAPFLPQLTQIALSLLPPVIDLIIAILPQLTKLIDAFTWLAKNVMPIVIFGLEGLAKSFRDSIGDAATSITWARDTIGAALEKIGGFFSGLGDKATIAWKIIVAAVKVSVAEIGKFLVGLPDIEIPDIIGIPGRGTRIGFRDLGTSMVQWGTTAASGGLMRGPGSATSDSIPVRLSNGEYVVNAKSTAQNLSLLEALNAGWVPSPDFVRMLVGANSYGFAAGGMVTAGEKARMGGGTVNLSIWQAIKSRFPNAVLTSAKTDHGIDKGFHPKGQAIDVSPDRQILDYLWSNRDKLAQIIFDDAQKVWYNVNGERAEGAKARAIYGEGEMKQHGNHIHVAALREFSDTGIATPQQQTGIDNRSDKEKVVDEIVAVGKSMGASDADITAALATGLVESNLKNVNYGPDGSTGVFQQRNFDEWTKGGTRDRNKVSDAAKTFFEKYAATDKSLTPGQRAQAVQRSAYPAKYDQRMAEAGQLYKESQQRGAGAATSAPGGSTAGATSTASTPGGAQPVFVTNWPTGGIGGNIGGSAVTSPSSLTDTATTTMKSAATPSTPEQALRDALAGKTGGTPEEQALRETLAATPPAGTPRPGAPAGGAQATPQQGKHPLADLKIPVIPGGDKLFQGPAPWYMAASPEEAFANLNTQATSLAQRTGDDVTGFFKNNWREMLNTGLAIAGMGAGGGGAPQMVVNNTGMDPKSAAAAIERVVRRRTLANQRGGGFGR